MRVRLLNPTAVKSRASDASVSAVGLSSISASSWLRLEFRDRASAATPADRAAPVTNPSDDRSPAAMAYQWASRIMVVAMEMVLPGLAGHWLDEQLGTVVLFLLIGLAWAARPRSFQLIQMTRSDESAEVDDTIRSKSICLCNLQDVRTRCMV